MCLLHKAHNSLKRLMHSALYTIVSESQKKSCNRAYGMILVAVCFIHHFLMLYLSGNLQNVHGKEFLKFSYPQKYFRSHVSLYTILFYFFILSNCCSKICSSTSGRNNAEVACRIALIIASSLYRNLALLILLIRRPLL